jgi:ABC-type branched-subunit amino acid transport system ATPase component
MDALTAEGISSGYGKSMIVHDVSIAVAAGLITTIVGPNGAGKSTFAKTLAGIIRPAAGRITVGGTDVTRVPGHMFARHGLGYVPQNDNVFRSMTVKENLEIGGFASKGEPRTRMQRVLDIFPDLRKAEAKKAGNLSGGQQNLLAMARALMAEPTVIILDEPTAGLSPAYTSVVWEQIVRIAAEGTAVLVIEQNVERALAHAHFVHVLVAGANHVHGPADEIARLDLAGIFLGHDRSANHHEK